MLLDVEVFGPLEALAGKHELAHAHQREGFHLRSELLWQKLYRERLTGDANARMVRSALDIVLENQAGRLVRLHKRERHELCELQPEDLDGVESQLRESHND